MRIVHTADWHVGRIWKNVSRLEEMEAILDHLARYLVAERIDLLLVAGDVFDAHSPPADAERVVFRFFHRIGQAGIPSVVIAGNHDHPTRIDAWGTLAALAGVRTVGTPRSADSGGVVEIPTRNGIACVAALPFASSRTWTRVLGDRSGNDPRSYAAIFRQAVAALQDRFRLDTVNLAMAHTHVQGAAVGTSERPLHVAPEWAVLPEDFPARAQYVALGHIHRPQRIAGAAVETRFAGSALQLDFGEAGDEKSFVLVEAEPGRAVKTELVPYEGGRTLGDVEVSLDRLEHERAFCEAFGWVRVTVPLTKADPDLARKVRSVVPNALVVHAELPEVPRLVARRPARGATAVDHYRAYLKQMCGQETPSESLLNAFGTLYESARGDGDAPAPADA